MNRADAAKLIGIAKISLNTYIKQNNPDWFDKDNGLVDTTLATFIEYKERENTQRRPRTTVEHEKTASELEKIQKQRETDLRTKIATMKKKEADAERAVLEVLKMKGELVLKENVSVGCLGLIERLQQELLHCSSNHVDDVMSSVRAGKTRHDIELVMITNIEKIIKRAHSALERNLKSLS